MSNLMELLEQQDIVNDIEKAHDLLEQALLRCPTGPLKDDLARARLASSDAIRRHLKRVEAACNAALATAEEDE